MRLRVFGIRSFVLAGLLCVLAAGPTGASEWEDPTPHAIALASVRDVTCDGSDNCWFATWAGVSVHTAADQWVSFTAANSPLAHDYCHDVAPGQGNLVWISHHYAGGVDLLDHGGTPADPTDDRWLNFPLDNVLPEQHGWVEDLYIDSSGRKWLGHGAGVTVLDDGGTPFDPGDDTWTNYTSSNAPLPSGFVNAIVEDYSGCIWVGGDDGPLARLCGTTWDSVEWHGLSNCLDCCWSWPGWVWELAIDDAGTLWMADGRCGIAWYSGAQWSFCDVHDPDCGLPDVPTSGADLGVRSVATSGANVWIGTRGRGAARRDSSGKWQEYPAAETDWLGSDEIEAIAFERDGRGWFGTSDAGAFEYVPATTSSTTVTPLDGGNLSAPDGILQVNFPEGAVSEPTVITYSKATAPSTGARMPMYAFSLEAQLEGDGTPITQFSVPYSVTVSYASAGSGPIIEASLRFYWWDEGKWVLEPSSALDLERQQVIATPDHMTLFAVLGESHRVYAPLVQR